MKVPKPSDLPDDGPGPTQALHLDDIEEIDELEDDDLDSLIADAEKALDDVVTPDREPLPSGRPPEEPPRKLPTIGSFGDYAIVGRLALGGMAEILLAREETENAGGRYVVVKRILPEYEKDASFTEMFLDEARVMMRLKHPNVTHVYKFGQVDGTHYIAMEYVNGASLGKLIRKARKTGGVPVHIACKIIGMVGEALDHAHQATREDGTPLAIVHRDVTPDNIMISYDGAVKLLDFGIAKAATRAHKTQAGVVKGKFAYMAPEQCRAKDLDHRVDVFALGVCLYEAITGRPLYRRETEFETMEAIVRGAVPKLADRVRNPPAELEGIIAKCLAKKPEDRYESAGALQEALDHFIAHHDKVVTARKIKQLMVKLFAQEMKRGPSVDTTPFGSSFHIGSDIAGLENLAFSTGDGDALPDLPLPEPPEPLVDDPFMLGPQAEPDDARPGAAGTLSERAGKSLYQKDPVGGPGMESPMSRDRRPPPTAPPVGRAIRPEPEARGSSGAVIAIGVVAALAVLGGVGWVLYSQVLTAGDDDGMIATEVPVLEGALQVDSEPTGAALFIDDEAHGTTPATVEGLSTGTHRLRLELDGYTTHEGPFEIRADETTELSQPLTSEVPAHEQGAFEMGTLTLTSTPEAMVILDGEELGRTPLRDVRVPAGVLRLDFRTDDGETIRRGVLVRPNDSTSSHVDLRE